MFRRWVPIHVALNAAFAAERDRDRAELLAKHTEPMEDLLWGNYLA